MNKLCLLLVVTSSAIMMSGCVTGRRAIVLEVPATQSTAEAAKGTVAITSISDDRLFENEPESPSTPSIDGDVKEVSKEFLSTMIGRQRNGYGAAMGDISLANGETIDSYVSNLVGEAFQRRGYSVTDAATADTNVEVSIEKFWAWFTPGMWAVSFESEIQTEIAVTTPTKTAKLAAKGYGINRGQVASDANWQLAYIRGFDDYLANLVKVLEESGF